MTALELDPVTRQVVEDFDAHSKKRAAELLASTPNEPLQATREIAFCLGYKAGVVDLGASLRERHGVSLDQLETVFAAACAWRDSSWIPDAVRGKASDIHVQQLAAVIDAARARDHASRRQGEDLTMSTDPQCDHRDAHDLAADVPTGNRCASPATHRIEWADGRYSFGCDAHLEIDDAATIPPIGVVKLDTREKKERL